MRKVVEHDKVSIFAMKQFFFQIKSELQESNFFDTLKKLGYFVKCSVILY